MRARRDSANPVDTPIRRLGARAWKAISDRTVVVHRGLGQAPPAVTMVCVYRRRNAAHVLQLISQLPPMSDVHLHALDDRADELAQWTTSVGPGMRMNLLSELLKSRSAIARPLLIADDDVAFVSRGGLQRFLTACSVGPLDLAMPAHHEDSVYTFRVTARRPWRTARVTAFVEVGPLVWLSTRAQGVVLPFPGGSGMGWGVDVRWSAQAAGNGLVMGVVDASAVRHLGVVGAGYEVDEARRRSDQIATSVGVDSAYDLAHDLGPVWRPWQRRAPWAADHPSLAK